jgi:hypothetical protein
VDNVEKMSDPGAWIGPTQNGWGRAGNYALAVV